MRRVIGLVLILAVLVAGLFFGLLNADPVTLDYYISTRSLPLSVLLVLAVVVGAILGIVAALAHILRLRREVRRLRRDMRRREAELERTRALRSHPSPSTTP